jgi:hypothetical protein
MQESTSMLPKIYKRSFRDLSLFFWIEGQKRLMPTITIEQSIFLYHKYVGETDWYAESMLVTYNRMKKEFYESQK